MQGDAPDPRIETILAQALGKTDAAERAAFLEQTCEQDFVLRRSLEKMIEDHTRADGSAEDAASGLYPDATEGISTDRSRPGAPEPAPLQPKIPRRGTRHR